MTEIFSCEQALLAQADFDGELDPARAAELESHRKQCLICQAQYEDFARLRMKLRQHDLRFGSPREFRRVVEMKTATMTPLRRARANRSVVSFAAGALAAAVISVMFFDSGQDSRLLDQIVDDHVRALQPGHLLDVRSTDKHTVKPWFDGRIDFAPPVKDLVQDQFPLTGGRLDYLDGRPIAALVYQHGQHVINLFVWPIAGSKDGVAGIAARRGYNVIHWRQGELMLWAVSDLERDQLDEFVRLWMEAS